MGGEERAVRLQISLLITDTEKVVVTGTTEARKDSLEHCSIELAALDWLRQRQS